MGKNVEGSGQRLGKGVLAKKNGVWAEKEGGLGKDGGDPGK